MRDAAKVLLILAALLISLTLIREAEARLSGHPQEVLT